MPFDINLRLQVNDNKVFEDYNAEHDFLDSYFSRVNQAVEHSLKVAHITSKGAPLSLKTRETSAKNNILDALFEDLGVEIFEDDFQGELPLHGIKRSDYIRAKKILKDIASGNSNIKIDENATPEFRQAVLTDILILLTRPTSRALFFEIDDCCLDTVTIIQGNSPGFFIKDAATAQKCIILPKTLYSAVISETPNKEKFFSPLPRYVAIGHELIHYLHSCTTGCLSDYLPTLDEDFDDLEEQFTITGDGGGVFPDHPICEQAIRQEFNLPLRSNHTGENFRSDIDPWYVSNKGATPLHRAASSKAILNLRYFFENGGTLDDIFNNKYLLLYSQDANITELLLDQGIPVDAIDCCRNTALNYAICAGKRDVVELLIQKGCPVDLPNSDGLLPINLAVNRGDIKIIQLLQNAMNRLLQNALTRQGS